MRLFCVALAALAVLAACWQVQGAQGAEAMINVDLVGGHQSSMRMREELSAPVAPAEKRAREHHTTHGTVSKRDKTEPLVVHEHEPDDPTDASARFMHPNDPILRADHIDEMPPTFAPIPNDPNAGDPHDAAVQIRGRLSAHYLQSARLHVTPGGFTKVYSRMNTEKKLKCPLFSSRQARTGVLSAREMLTPHHGTMMVSGTVEVKGDIVHEGAAVFLEESLSVFSHGAEDGAEDGEGFDTDQYFRQWSLVAHDDFDASRTHGWMLDDRSGEAASEVRRCAKTQEDWFLLAGCAGPHQLNVTKRYENLPPHTQLELEARVHFVGGWRGHSAFARVDGQYVWVDTHGRWVDNQEPPAELRPGGEAGGVWVPEGEQEFEPASVGSSFCDEGWHGDKISVPVKVIVPHTASTVEVAFGTTLPRGASTSFCTASLGLDDVALYVH